MIAVLAASHGLMDELAARLRQLLLVSAAAHSRQVSLPHSQHLTHKHEHFTISSAGNWTGWYNSIVHRVDYNVEQKSTGMEEQYTMSESRFRLVQHHVILVIKRNVLLPYLVAELSTHRHEFLISSNFVQHYLQKHWPYSNVFAPPTLNLLLSSEDAPSGVRIPWCIS